ncbi:MAG: CTP synthetase, partial [Candidatus Wukongarchaeota archaeon]|nr:CTP synthetase [Candidatus Wukongarchaeota archaeon]
EKIVRRHRHRFEVNPEYIQILEKNGLVFSGRSEDGRLMEILELPNHLFFFGTQFHPEFDSRPAKPEPAYLGFIKAAVERELKTKIIEATS